MNYFEIKIYFEEVDPWKEIFTSLLGEVGCDSFMDGDTDHILLAYIPESLYSEAAVKEVLENHSFEVKLHYSVAKIEAQNWNAVWESNFPPVLIADKCFIRAPFHESRQDVEYEIIIEPKMSFGTAHHETTSLMIEYILEEDVAGKKVLDMGAGTGILAILARKKGATPIMAIDNDEWAYLNNIENNQRNNTPDIEVVLGDADSLKNKMFDLIIANINRNILLNDLPAYANALQKGGTIFMSGFYQEDCQAIIDRGAEFNLHYVSHKVKNNWVAVKLIKQ